MKSILFIFCVVALDAFAQSNATNIVNAHTVSRQTIATPGVELGTNHIAIRTNYVAANFAPQSGYIKLVGSNNAVFSVSTAKTNLIVAP